MRVVLDQGAYPLEKAHDWDAGWDIRSKEAKVVSAKGDEVFDTGIHVEIPHGFVGFLKSKSGLNVKHGITSEGVIDSEYQGSIVVKLYNLSDTDYCVEAGDKISQLVLLPIGMTEMEYVDEFTVKTERGNKGFGSTGR